MHEQQRRHRNLIHRFLVIIGGLLRVARVIAAVAAVLAFLIFVFSDNLVGRVMERSIKQELRYEELSRSAMRPTPVEGYTLLASQPVSAELRHATLAPDALGVWITSGDGRLLHYSLSARSFTDTVEPEGITSLQGLAVAEDGRLLVSDPSGAVAYVDRQGTAELVYLAQPGDSNPLMPLRAIEYAGTLLILNGGEPHAIVSWTEGNLLTWYEDPSITDMLTQGGYLYVLGGHESGLPVAKLSTAGVDSFAGTEESWAWALPYWDVPFVALDVDELGFIFMVDVNGHLVQLSPTGRVIQQLPPRGEELGPARAVTVLPDGGLLVVHERGIKEFELNQEGMLLREALIATLMGDHSGAIPLWEELVEQEPYLISLRRLLGNAYLATEQPDQAAKQFYLAADSAGFDAAVGMAAYRVRKESLWRVWVTLMGLAVALWVLHWVWSSAVTPTGRRR